MIQYCATYNLNNDVCTLCNTGYTQTSDQKGCRPIIRECLTYTLSTFNTVSLTCITCNYPYLLSNNQCTIAGCQTLNYSTARITCDLCVNGNVIRNQDNNVCFAVIEKCFIYSFGKNGTVYTYSCNECELLYEPNSSGSLCVTASYIIYGWSGSSVSSGVISASYFYVDIYTMTLFYGSYSSSQSSQYSSLWYVQGYANNMVTLRVIANIVDPILGQIQEALYLAYNSSSNTFYIQNGFSSSSVMNGIPIPELKLQFLITPLYANNNRIVKINAFNSNPVAYLGYSTVVSSVAVGFYLN